MTTTTKGLTGLNALLGTWLFLSPWLFMAAMPARAGAWSAWIVGAAIAIIAGANFVAASRGREAAPGASGVNAVLGAYVAISPLFYAYGVAMTWNVVIVGLLVLAFAGYAAYEASRARTPVRA